MSQATGTRSRAHKAGAMVRESAARAAQIGSEGAQSGAYFYPVKGVFYMLSHPKLLRPLLPTIALSLFVSLCITVFLFSIAYLPTAAVMTIFNGPLGFIAAAGLVFSFAGTVVNALARSLFLQGALETLFDQVLMEHQLEGLVAQGREIQGAGAGKQLGKVLTAPLARFSPEAIMRYIISLPLNLIPIVGTVFFLIYNGTKGGPGYHARYFQLKKMSTPQKNAFIHDRRGAYSSFGITAQALTLIPLVSIFFTFTSEVGAALWACDEEKRGKLVGKLDEGAGAVHR